MNKKLQTFELGRISESEFKASKKLPLTLVLDNIRSGLNIGSVFRTSDAFRLERVVLCGICAQPPHRDILKSALGATETVEWNYAEETTEAVGHLRENGYQIACVEQVEKSLELQDWLPKSSEKWALVLGNEVRGVQQDIIDHADVCLEIPQFGNKHSLNVSVCAGMVVWHYFLNAGQEILY
jgi:23S rRNA (guanosine2251-2'-O)-methyltransferase